MPTIDTSLIQLRNNLSSFVEQAHYTNTQVRLTRHNKPLARIVGEDFMQNLERLLEQDPGLRETLEIMSDKNMVEMITESQEDVQRGNLRPLIDALQE
jgi:prevent-host-death family protein